MSLYEEIKEKGDRKILEIICGNIDSIGETLTNLNRRIMVLEKNEGKEVEE